MIHEVLLAAVFVLPIAEDPSSTLRGFARLRGGTLRDGPPCGEALSTHPRATDRLPAPRQLVSGISGFVSVGDGQYLALSDNGFGARANSADYRLAFHHLSVDFETKTVAVRSSIELRDPNRLAGFPIANAATSDRVLTGADFDPESIQRAPDGSLWLGDEFGPFLLHFSSEGLLLEPPIEPPMLGELALRSKDHPAFRNDAAGAGSAPVDSSSGFEALALSSDGLSLFALLEKPLLASTSRECLAFEFDLTTRRYSGTSFSLPLPSGASSFCDAQFHGARSLLVLERDDSEGARDGWKRVAAYALDPAGPATRRPIADLLDLDDRNGLAPCEAGDFGCGDGKFALPFLTIESLWIEDDSHLVIGVDDNYPLSRGRHVGNDAPDDTEIVRIALPTPLAPHRLRVATYNASMNRATATELVDTLERGEDPQIEKVARVLQEVRPDVVLLQEFDVASEEVVARAIIAFRERYLRRSIDGSVPIEYPFAFAPRANTGVASGIDLNGDGQIGRSGREYGDDALGFGAFPGQYGFVVFSRYPLDPTHARTFSHLLWRDVPGTVLPDDKTTPKKSDFFSDAALAVLPFSSKNHVDLPLLIGGRTIHLLLSHPTPPAFDGPEDKNGLRNAAEIRFWLDYLTPGQDEWIADAQGHVGGLAEDASFVILGDLNSDPFDGDSRHDVIRMLLSHRRLVDPAPRSRGAIESATTESGKAPSPRGDVARRTADFGVPKPGDLRVDYVLPSVDLEVFDAGVYWPVATDPLARLVDASDHRLVFVDLVLRDG